MSNNKKNKLESFIKKIILEEVETLVANNVGFNIKQFENIKSYKQRLDYANQNLKKLGAGSSRIVYDLGNNTVLKLAKNDKGIAQNNTEANLSTEDLSIVAKILSYDPNYIYIVMEKADKMKPTDFKNFFGYDYNTVDRFLRNYYELSKGRRSYFHVDPEIDDKLYDNEYINDIINLYHNFNILPQDLARLANWGIVIRNNQKVPVIIDYGFDDKVASSLYKLKLEYNNKKI